MSDKSRSSETITIQMSRPASTASVYTRGLWVAMFRRQGDLSDEQVAAIPSFTVEMNGITPDPKRVALFREVCAIGEDNGELPALFPETMFLSMMARLFSNKRFPLSPLGLIHMKQSAIVHEPIATGTPLDLRVHLAELVKTERGIHINCAMEVRQGETLCWEGMANFLSRSSDTRSGKTRKQETKKTPPPEARSTLELAGDLGRRFAAGSGDYNPHHLYPFTAKLLGYKRPIAHGMWTLSRALSEVMQQHAFERPFKIEGEFKRPIFLPGKINLSFSEDSEAGEGAFRFGAHDPKSGAPHLLGSVAPYRG